MKETRQIQGKQQIRATFDPKTINVEKRTIDVVFATEGQVMMWEWDLGWFYEILPCNEAEGDLSRLNNGAPLCDTHNTWSVKLGLGVVERAWFDSGVGRATVRFSKRDDVEPVWKDVIDGIITGVSVGYVVFEYQEVGVKENLPLVRASKWQPSEISLALVQADADSGVGRSAEQKNVSYSTTFIRNHKNSTMTEAEKAAQKADRRRSAQIFKACRAANLTEDETQEFVESEMPLADVLSAIDAKKRAQAPPAADPAPQPDPGAAERQSLARNERERISSIRSTGRLLSLPDSFIDNLIEKETPIDKARELMINEGARLNPVAPALNAGVSVGTDEKDKKTRGMESSIMQRAGILKADVVGDPGEFRGMTLMDMAKECLKDAGVNTRGMEQHEIAQRALKMASRSGGGGLSTGDFSFVLQNVMNKTLRQMYDLQPRTFTSWARKATASDFKTILRTQLNDITLSKVQQGGEYSYAKINDSGETYSVAKFGRVVNLDWETIINDDLDAFSRIPAFMAGAVAQLQGDTMYSMITGSHLMGDGNQLFDAANHFNYTSVGTAITVNSLGIGRKQFRQQKSPGGSPLNLAPKYLLVGPNKEQEALQYTSDLYVATKNSDINVWRGLITPIVDARITDNSWYLVADPNQIDTAEYATIDGQEIFTDTNYGFNVDALQWKVRAVFGGKAIEWRSFYKNAGA